MRACIPRNHGQFVSMQGLVQLMSLTNSIGFLHLHSELFLHSELGSLSVLVFDEGI